MQLVLIANNNATEIAMIEIVTASAIFSLCEYLWTPTHLEFYSG